MARPTGQQSKARRVPTDVDAAIQQEADRRGIGWADELRRVYVDGTPERRKDRAAVNFVEATAAKDGSVGTIKESAVGPARCRCAKPIMSKTVTNVCTVCHLIR